MAFESGELAAETILSHHSNSNAESLAADYTETYRHKFASRLRLCSLLRRAAFNSHLTELGVTLFGASERFRNRVARATRSPAKANHHSV